MSKKIMFKKKFMRKTTSEPRKNEEKKKKIFTNKLQLKRYLSSREIDLRMSQEAYEEIERQLQRILHDLIHESKKKKNDRKAKILSGKDVLITVNKDYPTVEE